MHQYVSTGAAIEPASMLWLTNGTCRLARKQFRICRPRPKLHILEAWESWSLTGNKNTATLREGVARTIG